MNLISHPPRIPAVKTYADFRAFSQAGRDLAHWHLNYETVACHPGVVVEEALASASSQAPTVTDHRYRVTKMRFALEWVMELQSVTTDKDSGITNDANLWATETMGNARYPLELFLRVVTVSRPPAQAAGGRDQPQVRRIPSHLEILPDWHANGRFKRKFGRSSPLEISVLPAGSARPWPFESIV